jgi:carbamoyl-phosphate synthase large subunit
VRNEDKEAVIPIARELVDQGFQLLATAGTYQVLAKSDIPATRVSKLAEGRPNIKDYIKNGQIAMIINTPTRKGPGTDEGKIRAMSVINRVPIVTTLAGASAAAKAIKAMRGTGWGVKPLQSYFPTK